MTSSSVARDTTEKDDRTLYRVGGIAAIAVAVAYPVIVALFVLAGVPLPVGEGGEAWLDYLSGNEAVWWAIIGLSVLTDILWVPVAWALYRCLRSVDRNMMAAGAGLLVLFVVLELATSWTNFAVLTQLSSELASASTDAERAAILSAAGSAAAAESSGLLPYYAILIPGVGKLLIGLVMLKGGPFGRVAAWLAVLVGIIGIVAVLGPIVWSPLGQVIVPGSLLSGLWFLLVGWRMLKLGESAPAS